MFSIPGLVLLVGLTLVRPQEFVTLLQGTPILTVLALFTVLGMIVDLKVGLVRFRKSPVFWWALLFHAWATFTVLVRAPNNLVTAVASAVTVLIVFLGISQGLAGFRSIRLFVAFLVAVVGMIASVSLMQVGATSGCMRLRLSKDQINLSFDGRTCVSEEDCYETSLEDGVNFQCEGLGPLGTSTIGGRIRYRGVLADPNELALLVVATLPLALAALEWRRSLGRVALVAIATVGCTLVTVFTQSRGGQLAFLAMFGVYFVRRFRWKGVIIAAVMAAPVMLLGGRSGDDADESSLLRLEAWRAAIEMWKAYPLLGVGKNNFTEHHFLTAHSSYFLTLAELGVPGLFLWTGTVYAAVKSMLVILWRAKAPEARIALVYGSAVLACLGGLVTAVMLLSFAYSQVFWAFVGLAGGVAVAATQHEPKLAMRMGVRDFLAIGALDGAIGGAIALYLRFKGV